MTKNSTMTCVNTDSSPSYANMSLNTIESRGTTANTSSDPTTELVFKQGAYCHQIRLQRNICPSSLRNARPCYCLVEIQKWARRRIILLVFVVVCFVVAVVVVAVVTVIPPKSTTEQPGGKLRRLSHVYRMEQPQQGDDDITILYHPADQKTTDNSHTVGRRRLNYLDPYNDPKSVVWKQDPTSQQQKQEMQQQQTFLQQPRASIYKNPITSAESQTPNVQQQQQQQPLALDQQPNQPVRGSDTFHATNDNNYNNMETPQQSQQQRSNAAEYMDPKNVVWKDPTVTSQDHNMQQPPMLPQQPRASIYKDPVTDAAQTHPQEPPQQQQIAAPLNEPLEAEAASSQNNVSTQSQNIEIPQHMQQQQPQHIARQPVEFLGAAAIDTTRSDPHAFSKSMEQQLQHMQQEQQLLDQPPIQGMEGAATNVLEIPQHLLPNQPQQSPMQKQSALEGDNFDTQAWGEKAVGSLGMQGTQLGTEIPPMDELTRRWGEPSAEELEENVVVLPNQEQTCPLSKFNPMEHAFDFTPKNLTIAEKLQLSGYKDVWDWKMQPTDLPVFWHIPKSGGSTVKDIMGSCHRFVMASEAGIRAGHDNDTQLAIVKVVGDERNRDGSTPFINVDTTTVEGIHRAKRLGLAQCGLARAIVIRHVFESDILFDSEHKGRLFAVFRHPVDRQVSLFNYLKIATWEPTYIPEFANMTLKEYVRSPYVEYNWLTRYLSGDKEGTLTQEHMRAAMDVVRRKFLVGLLSRKEETMERFEQYFEWTYRVNPKNQEICRDKLLKSGANTNTNKGERAKPNTPVYETLLQLNKYDIQLYNYIESLFDEQADFVKDKKDGFRLEGATCCKCHRYPQC